MILAAIPSFTELLGMFDMLKWFPENVSTFGHELDNLFAFIYYISLGIFFLTYGVLIAFMIKYRRKDNVKAYYYHGNNLVEFTWTLLPTILFAGIGLYSDGMWEKTKYEKKVPVPDVEVQVMGYQYGWTCRYPGPDGTFGRQDRNQMTTSNRFGIDSADAAGKDDIVKDGSFTFPINRNIVVGLSASDVLHSFFLPNFRVKQDAVPGQWIKVWFNGTKVGKYELACAELCGSGHYNMRGEVTMLSQADFDKWLSDESAKKLGVSFAVSPVKSDSSATKKNDSTATVVAVATTDTSKTTNKKSK
ncbi:MAG: cytochrome c oxidase subunit II [Candidatus Kapabacteria bacterium]|nr:cytochrome c oxidase subunit II [Candidatus Kapabacteria bacterium]